MCGDYPDVYLFNASNDVALAHNRPSFTPTSVIRKLEDDLSCVPFVFARPRDLVVVEQAPPESYLAGMEELGFKLPQFVAKKDFFGQSYLKDKQFGAIKPWGWSPHAHHLLGKAKEKASESFLKSTNGRYNPILRELSGRRTARNVLRGILAKDKPYTHGMEALPVEAKSIDDIKGLLGVWPRLVVKEPWSSSGRGVYMLDEKKMPATALTGIASAIKKQGYVMVEPWFKRVTDLSFLFSVTSKNISFLGESIFITKESGEYTGSYINGGDASEETRAFRQELVDSDFIEILTNELIAEGFDQHYEGWMGVDAMLVMHDGNMKLHPCLEINCRYTMGHVSHQLRNFVSLQATWMLKVGGIDDYRATISNRTSLRAEGGLIVEGTGNITPVNENTRFVCWIEEVQA